MLNICDDEKEPDCIDQGWQSAVLDRCRDGIRRKRESSVNKKYSFQEDGIMKNSDERNLESTVSRNASPDWRVMWKWMQEIHRFSRNMTKQQQNRELTMGEMEILAVVSLEDKATPLGLSRATGMKLEAVSRTLRSLEAKGCIRREKILPDARSVLITLSEKGGELLKKDCSLFLGPLYRLEREMGEETREMVALIEHANRLFSKAEETGKKERQEEKEEKHEIL